LVPYNEKARENMKLRNSKIGSEDSKKAISFFSLKSSCLYVDTAWAITAQKGEWRKLVMQQEKCGPKEGMKGEMERCRKNGT